ncbi:MAG TPA: hypothetical protein VEH01_03090 [Nitrososphaerales archaeon]|nr:hypothetical protein [Nitrososphaerales archaeon]
MSSEDLVEGPFTNVAKRVDEAYDRAEEELKAGVNEAKAQALKKISG